MVYNGLVIHKAFYLSNSASGHIANKLFIVLIVNLHPIAIYRYVQHLFTDIQPPVDGIIGARTLADIHVGVHGVHDHTATICGTCFRWRIRHFADVDSLDTACAHIAQECGHVVLLIDFAPAVFHGGVEDEVMLLANKIARNRIIFFIISVFSVYFTRSDNSFPSHPFSFICFRGIFASGIPKA